MFAFRLLATDHQARAGELVTPHGVIETPSFVAVGTQAAAKALSTADLQNMGTQVLITNAYHLHLLPGEDLIQEMGGLHRFMGWKGPLMTDSGGFQIFSQGAGREHGVGKIAPIFPEEQDRGGHFSPGKRKPLAKLCEEGVDFTSYLDGSRHRFTPEEVIQIGRKLGTDIVLVLDECTSPLHDYDYTRAAMKRTHRWALRALDAFQQTPSRGQALFGIVQGGAYQDLREESTAFIAGQEFDGFAIGGSLGRSKGDMHRVLAWTIPSLPPEKPRHLLGIGDVEDIFDLVRRGIDLFDCVAPTRMARTGTLLSTNAHRHRIHIRNDRFRNDPRPIDEGCRCYTCSNYSRAYLRHLFMARELSAPRLASIHNLHFIESWMRRIRAAIKENSLDEMAGAVLGK